MKKLYILRHAKAENGQLTDSDHDRALAERGQRDALKLGEYLKKQGIQIDTILCSDAKRTRQTCEQLQQGGFKPGSIEFVPKLYNAPVKDVLRVVAGVPDDITSLMVIGHNPGLHQLCMDLVHMGNESLQAKLAMRFPTCSFVSLSYPAEEWHEVGARKATLESFLIPSDLAELA